jgi:rubrerythrin
MVEKKKTSKKKRENIPRIETLINEEKEALILYGKMAKKEKDEANKKVLERIAKQEGKHEKDLRKIQQKIKAKEKNRRKEEQYDAEKDYKRYKYLERKALENSKNPNLNKDRQDYWKTQANDSKKKAERYRKKAGIKK